MDLDAASTRRTVLARFGFGAMVAATVWTFRSAGAEPPAPKRAPASPGGAFKAPVVMLDPGHGGKDPGAIGVAGTYEKIITLAVSRDLRALLEKEGRYRVEATRARDVFVPLEERVARARAKGAALMVSIHADALPDHAVRGASVYTLGAQASDSLAAELARRENSADRFLGAGWRDSPPEVARILGSLARRETKTGAARIQRAMVAQLDRDLPMLPNPSRHAGFAVLKAADIPSVLIEMGFMSNARDEAALRKPEHRRMVAAAMKRAIDAYFAAATHAGVEPGARLG